MFDSSLAAHKLSTSSMQLSIAAIALAALYVQASAAPTNSSASQVSCGHDACESPTILCTAFY